MCCGAFAAAARSMRCARAGRHAPQGRRMAAAEEALAQARAAEEPLAGGDRLWRRAQELLGADGPQLSRRTPTGCWRACATAGPPRRAPLTSQCGARGAAAAPGRPAADPRRAALAQCLLPEDPERGRRGNLLRRRCARRSLGCGRPASPPASTASWWPYLICTASTRSARAACALKLAGAERSRPTAAPSATRWSGSLPAPVARRADPAAPVGVMALPLPRTPGLRRAARGGALLRLAAAGRGAGADLGPAGQRQDGARRRAGRRATATGGGCCGTPARPAGRDAGGRAMRGAGAGLPPGDAPRGCAALRSRPARCGGSARRAGRAHRGARALVVLDDVQRLDAGALEPLTSRLAALAHRGRRWCCWSGGRGRAMGLAGAARARAGEARVLWGDAALTLTSGRRCTRSRRVCRSRCASRRRPEPAGDQARLSDGRRRSSAGRGSIWGELGVAERRCWRCRRCWRRRGPHGRRRGRSAGARRHAGSRGGLQARGLLGAGRAACATCRCSSTRRAMVAREDRGSGRGGAASGRRARIPRCSVERARWRGGSRAPRAWSCWRACGRRCAQRPLPPLQRDGEASRLASGAGAAPVAAADTAQAAPAGRRAPVAGRGRRGARRACRAGPSAAGVC